VTIRHPPRALKNYLAELLKLAMIL